MDNLYFDNATRTYERDPASYANFWAADEPEAGPEPYDKQFTLSGLDPKAQYYFRLKCVGVNEDGLNPDLDRDGDGFPDCMDSCPDDPLKAEPGICGCGMAENDSELIYVAPPPAGDNDNTGMSPASPPLPKFNTPSIRAEPFRKTKS